MYIITQRSSVFFFWEKKNNNNVLIWNKEGEHKLVK